MQTVAIIGATGAVGNEIVRLLAERLFPVKSLRCFASPRSIGRSIFFRDRKIPIELLTKKALQEIDLAFFAAGSAISKEWIPQTKALCIDSSSAFRMDPSVPLVIPEINPEALKHHKRIIASPNCTTTMLLMPLAPLHRNFRAKRIIVSSYQAASGGGAQLLKYLTEESKATLQGETIPSQLPFPYAFNVFPHNSALHTNGYVEEEMKMVHETRKILGDDSIRLTATCVRVPVMRAHSLAANVEFGKAFTLEEVYQAVNSMPGLKVFEDRKNNRFATPSDATGRNEVLCGRFRLDLTQPNTLEFWSVGDQLLKGAALNAVQIAETWLALNHSSLESSI